MTVNAKGILRRHQHEPHYHLVSGYSAHIDGPFGMVLSPTVTSASNLASTSLGRSFGSCHTSHATFTGPILVSSLHLTCKFPVTILSYRLRDDPSSVDGGYTNIAGGVSWIRRQMSSWLPTWSVPHPHSHSRSIAMLSVQMCVCLYYILALLDPCLTA